jgi:hypothetical protein
MEMTSRAHRQLVKAIEEDNDWIRLSDALRAAQQLWPWASPAVLREAVTAGTIPSYRTSQRKRSWYYVRPIDLAIFILLERKHRVI